jgi:hypothetical protein
MPPQALGTISSGTEVALGTEAGWGTVVKSADQSIQSDVTLDNDSELSFAVDANSRYSFRIVVHFETPAAADFKCDVNGPGSMGSVRLYLMYTPGGGTSMTTAIQTGFGNAVALTATGTSGAIIYEGAIETGASSGTVVFRWAQNSSTASNTTVKRGSYITWKKGA